MPILNDTRTDRLYALEDKAYESKEIHLYFDSEREFRLASAIYWERFNTRYDPLYFCRKYGVSYPQYNNLLGKYKKFQKHPYSRRASLV